MTYSGFLLFFFASFWNANLVGKLAAISAKWRALRQQEKRREHVEKVGAEDSTASTSSEA